MSFPTVFHWQEDEVLPKQNKSLPGALGLALRKGFTRTIDLFKKF